MPLNSRTKWISVLIKPCLVLALNRCVSCDPQLSLTLAMSCPLEQCLREPSSAAWRRSQETGASWPVLQETTPQSSLTTQRPRNPESSFHQAQRKSLRRPTEPLSVRLLTVSAHRCCALGCQFIQILCFVHCRKVSKCFVVCVLGVVAGGGRIDKPILKAGRAYHKYKAKRNCWPRVRGVAMNVSEHG